VKFEPKQCLPNDRNLSNGPSASQETDSGNWRSFPQFEKMLQAERPGLVATMEATCRQLESILISGSPQEKSRARAVLRAYERTRELYRRFANGGTEKSSAPGNEPADAHDK
jgi:hypothetical protein